VEVKTRINPLHRPLSAVTPTKRHYLRRGAAQYLQLLAETPPYRFDVVEVILTPGQRPACTHVRDIAMD